MVTITVFFNHGVMVHGDVATAALFAASQKGSPRWTRISFSPRPWAARVGGDWETIGKPWENDGWMGFYRKSGWWFSWNMTGWFFHLAMNQCISDIHKLKQIHGNIHLQESLTSTSFTDFFSRIIPADPGLAKDATTDEVWRLWGGPVHGCLWSKFSHWTWPYFIVSFPIKKKMFNSYVMLVHKIIIWLEKPRHFRLGHFQYFNYQRVDPKSKKGFLGCVQCWMGFVMKFK